MVGLLLFLPLFALRAMGGGDVKLLAAFGAWLGPVLVFWVAVYGAIAGGVLALLLVLWRRRLRATIANMWDIVTHWRLSGLKPHPVVTLDNPGAVRMPVRAADRARGAGHAVAAGVVRDNAVVVRLPARVRSQTGAELVEFAMVLPIMLLVFGGIVDFGLLLQREQVITNAAREGARLAVLPGYTSADVQARVTQFVREGINSDSAAPVATMTLVTLTPALDPPSRRRRSRSRWPIEFLILADRLVVRRQRFLWHDCPDRDHYHALETVASGS